VLRYLTAGESHGPALTAIVEGMPAGLQLTSEYINQQLARRQQGYGRGGRMQIETDKVELLSGVRGGKTLGSPISLQIKNKDWSNWSAVMAAGEADLESRRVLVPRPGHGDLAGHIKYGHQDVRNILERASARETAARVAACTVGRKLIEYYGMRIYSHVVQIGNVQANPASLATIIAQMPQSQMLCADPEAEILMKQAIDQAREKGDSLGGIFEIIVCNVPVGLGSHVHWDRKLDGKIAGVLMSIQAIKGVEIGLGFAAAGLPGSKVHDEIFVVDQDFKRGSNNAGGLEAGMTNGQNLVVRAAMKPIATLYNPLRSINLESGAEAQAAIERSDICAVPAAAVVGEAVVAFELAVAFMEKYGGDSISEMDKHFKA
jgi:chorismate synthase